mgnify:FL=1
MGKIPFTFTLDKEIVDKFKKMCEDSDIKMSTKINSLIKEWIGKNGENNS